MCVGRFIPAAYETAISDGKRDLELHSVRAAVCPRGYQNRRDQLRWD
jgi:hypothetical protein